MINDLNKKIQRAFGFVAMHKRKNGVDWVVEQLAILVFAENELRVELGEEDPAIVRLDELRKAAKKELDAISK